MRVNVPVEIAEHRVRLDGVEIAYLDTGEPAAGDSGADARPVLLLHGWPQDREIWQPVIERLAGSRRLIAPDLRGFGRSEAPGRGYDGPTFALDQVRLLDHLGIERADLIAHDWGGWTAFLLGLDHSERVGSALICNAPHPWPRLGPRILSQLPRSWYAATIATLGLGPALLRHGSLVRFIARHDGDTDTFSPAKVEEMVAAWQPAERAHAAHCLYRYYLRTFRHTALGGWRNRRIEAPVHLLFGRRDRMITARLVDRGLAEHAGRATVELVAGCGHFIVDRRPDLVADRARALFGATRR